MRNGLPIAAILSVLVFAGAWALMRESTDTPGGDLELYCAMGANEPVNEILKQYEKLYGVRTRVIYDGSKKLFNPIIVSGRGDLYLAADASYMDEARTAGIEIHETIPIAFQQPVIAVRNDFPFKMETVEDLKQDGIRLFLADAKLAAISKVVKKHLGQEKWASLWQRRVTGCDTVTQVANSIVLEKTGAGIIWDSSTRQYPDLKFIRIPELAVERSQITIGVLGSSRKATSALRLARFIAAADKGLNVFSEAGYDVVDGDVWAERPEIIFYGGGLNESAVRQRLREFENREGVRINSLFTGCGTLVGRMNPQGLAEQPDIYFACASSYMDKVAELFGEPVDVSGTDLVIAIPHGKGDVKQLADLAKSGLKIGLCDAELSALGALSQHLLEKHGLLDTVERNAKDYPGTAPALVAKVAADALDAAIVYRANATPMVNSGKIDIVSINDHDAYARQPIAIGRFSQHPHLCDRLVKAILATESRERFEALGFDWYGESAGQ